MPAGDRPWNKYNMTNDATLGQRIAMTWQELIEHMAQCTRHEIAASKQPHHTSGEKEKYSG